MKKHTMIKLASALILSATAGSAVAGSPYGEKPDCELGLIPVVKNGAWVCAQPSFQAPTAGQQQSSPATPGIKLGAIAKPERAKPDLSIVNIMKMNNGAPNVDSFKAYVKNTKGVASAPTKMSLSSNKGGGEVSVPAIAANSGQWVEVSFFAFDDGDRILLKVDSQDKIKESNEGNNNYAFNW